MPRGNPPAWLSVCLSVWLAGWLALYPILLRRRAARALSKLWRVGKPHGCAMLENGKKTANQRKAGWLEGPHRRRAGGVIPSHRLAMRRRIRARTTKKASSPVLSPSLPYLFSVRNANRAITPPTTNTPRRPPMRLFVARLECAIGRAR